MKFLMLMGMMFGGLIWLVCVLTPLVILGCIATLLVRLVFNV